MDRTELLREVLSYDVAPYEDYVRQSIGRFYASWLILARHCAALSNAAVIDVGGLRGVFVPALKATGAFASFQIVEYSGNGHNKLVLKSDRDEIEIQRHRANIEADRVPIADSSIDVAVFFETIEHLQFDPMHALLEINRILREGGLLFLSTPNLTSAAALKRMLHGQNPNLFTAYRDSELEYERHQREYTIDEVRMLLQAAGFVVRETQTLPIPKLRDRLLAVVARLALGAPVRWHELGEYMLLVSEKTEHLSPASCPPARRYPEPVYCMLGEERRAALASAGIIGRARN